MRYFLAFAKIAIASLFPNDAVLQECTMVSSPNHLLIAGLSHHSHRQAESIFVLTIRYCESSDIEHGTADNRYYRCGTGLPDIEHYMVAGYRINKKYILMKYMHKRFVSKVFITTVLSAKNSLPIE